MILLFIFWFIQIAVFLLTWSYWWQMKEYRLDRFIDFLKTPYSRENLRLKLFLITSILLTALLFSKNPPSYYLLIFLGVITVLTADILKRGLLRPKFTQRVYLSLLVSFVLILIPFFIFDYALAIVISELFAFVSLFIGFFATSFISEHVKVREINEAKRKLDSMDMIKIAVTGSYGKTSTKEFIRQLLSSKFKIKATPKGENTIFALVRSIASLEEDCEVFVAEMGAYKRGEIHEMARILKPDIGVISGIGVQHVSLFGSDENLKGAKFELVKDINSAGVAIFNLDSAGARDLFERAKIERRDLKLIGYSLKAKGKNKLKTKIVRVERDGVVVEVKQKGKSHMLKTNLRGKHFVYNLLAAIIVAHRLGVGWKDIEKASTDLTLPEGIMSVQKVANAIVIDDTRNTSEAGFLSALDYLSLFEKERKVVVTPGIIELGKKAKKVHERLANAMAGDIDRLVVTNDNYYPVFKSTVENTQLIKDAGKLKEVIEEEVGKEKCVILLEGRLTGGILKLVREKSKG